ncbi:hypothetical protein HUJ04_005077 [Dendroctonus ponderosae]|nr:hypothetical protein HUJ04_005077 [Dendroctonus ponderosae]
MQEWTCTAFSLDCQWRTLKYMTQIPSEYYMTLTNYDALGYLRKIIFVRQKPNNVICLRVKLSAPQCSLLDIKVLNICPWTNPLNATADNKKIDSSEDFTCNFTAHISVVSWFTDFDKLQTTYETNTTGIISWQEGQLKKSFLKGWHIIKLDENN